MDVDQLAPHLTTRQLEYVRAVEEHGSNRAAARALGVHPSMVDRAMHRVEVLSARLGHAPGHFDDGVAPGYRMGKVTIQRANGVVERVWERQHPDGSALEEVFNTLLEVLSEGVRGLAPLAKAPKRCEDDLLAVYPWGDPHIGMYAWAQEAGDDFDLDIAERLTFGAVDRLVTSAPPASTAILLPLGDFFHANDQSNVTPGHKHQLDVDSRFGKVLGVGIKTLRHAVRRLLEKHARVIVSIRRGNHDPEATWALRYAMSAYFENEPRVEVDLAPAEHWFYRFGSVLIGATHGDTVKHEGLLGVMAADRPEDWGATKHRYFYTGHVHNTVVKEFPGLLCESFRTLAAKDAYAAGHGYRAGRDMVCIVHHKDHGEVERHRCDVGMLQ